MLCNQITGERSETVADGSKETFPVIPAKHWRTLRKRFQQSIPASVTPGFLATTLGMQEQSAKSNIIPSLVQMGIIDDQWKPTERANRWRDDLEYPEVCSEIRYEVYPQELLDAAPGPSVDRQAVERWFTARTRAGKGAVGRYAVVYELLSSARVPEEAGRPRQPVKAKSAVPRKAQAATSDKLPVKRVVASATADVVPSIHIDIQIHISPDAEPDQIDQIFASMAKHLRTRND
jgi:hypothetical protein